MTSHKQRQQHRQIRAIYDDRTITVYQAYNTSIANSAVATERLDASPLFLPNRMTWVKPSWNWIMYRSGYSYKDVNQSNILALKLSLEFFHKLLLSGVLSENAGIKRDERTVRIQWDPERTVRLGKVDDSNAKGSENGQGNIRSIQIGIPIGWKEEWVHEGIVEIEDVTDRARELKSVLDEENNVTEEELKNRGLLPDERLYVLPEDIAKVIGTVV